MKEVNKDGELMNVPCRHYLRLLIASVILVAVLLSLIHSLTAEKNSEEKKSGEAIHLFCAASLRNVIEEIKESYQANNDIAIGITYGSSGQLETSLRMRDSTMASFPDVYIPADNLFSKRTDTIGLTRNTMVIARQRVVLAFDKTVVSKVVSLDDVLNSDIRFAFCHPAAGAGLKLKLVLSDIGRWKDLGDACDAVFPTVTEVANAIKNSSGIQAGFIWDTTARQFQLDYIELPELEEAVGMVTVSLVAGSRNKEPALSFVNYIAYDTRSAEYFENHFFSTRVN